MKRTLLFLTLFACGGSQQTAQHPCQQDPESCNTEAQIEGDTSDPWAEMTDGTLRDYVREHAWAKAREAQPEITPEALTQWLDDPSTAPSLSGRAVERLSDLAMVALAENDTTRAEGITRLVRGAARNRNSAYLGTTFLAESARRKAGSEQTAPSAIANIFRELPRSRFGSATLIFQFFQTTEQLNAQLGQIHQQLISLETARSALFFEQVLPGIVEHRADFLTAIETIQQEHESQAEPDEYAFGTVDLSQSRDAREVRVAVWDVGTSPERFPEQLFVNEAEEINGVDDDENGLIDDRHGVVQDMGEYTHMDVLYQPDEEVLTQYTPFLRGVMDLRAGITSSDDAQRVLDLLRSASTPEALEDLHTKLAQVGEWAHGTHVAGILLQGLPQAKMAIFRSAWAGERRLYHHRGPIDEELAEERENVSAIARFINQHQIRVVNASLGFSKEYVESELRYEQERYPTVDAVRARAEEVQAHRAETWRSVFSACPNTLFVVAAGNSNQDVMEYGVVPANSTQANVLVVGAVDRFGQWATFTNSHPEQVRIFDFGVGVPSVLPNGETVPLSGTSMASPNAANLAAKIISLNATLTPAEVITLIEETGDPIAEPFGGLIANETRAIQRVRRERRNR